MTVETLRHKRVDRTPVIWQGNYGWVRRVARDGSWADMVWTQCIRHCPPWWECNGPRWSKRQPLGRIADWQHG